jgi:hypothetical protein
MIEYNLLKRSFLVTWEMNILLYLWVTDPTDPLLSPLSTDTTDPLLSLLSTDATDPSLSLLSTDATDPLLSPLSTWHMTSELPFFLYRPA